MPAPTTSSPNRSARPSSRLACSASYVAPARRAPRPADARGSVRSSRSAILAERFRGPEPRGVLGGTERRDQTDENGEDADEGEVARAHEHGELRDEIHLRIERQAVDDEELAHDVAE